MLIFENSHFGKIIKKISYTFNIKVDVINLVIATIFWCYGFQAAIVNISLILNFCLLIYLLFFTYTLLWIKKKYPILSNWIIQLKASDLFIFTFFIIAYYLILGEKLSFPLMDDELYYAFSSLSYQIAVILKLTKYTDLISEIHFYYLINLINIILVISFYLLYLMVKYCYSNFSLITTAIFIFIITSLFRLIVYNFGGGLSTHPPLQLFQLWLSSTVFGVSSFSFRFAQFLCGIVFIFYLYRKFNSSFNIYISFIFSLFLTSIPLFMEVTTIVESSIVTTICISIILIEIIFSYEENIENWLLLSVLLSISILIRQTVVVLVPFYILLLLYRFKDTLKVKHYIFVISVFSIPLPYVLKSIIEGTPATYIPYESELFIHSVSVTERILYAINNNIVINIILSNIEWYFLLLISGLFVPLKLGFTYWKRFFFVVLLFLSLIFTFYSIRPVLWSTDRYVAEYILPFVIVGGFSLFHLLFEIKHQIMVCAFAIFLIINSAMVFHKYPDNLPDIYQNSILRKVTHNYVDYISALKQLSLLYSPDSIILVGVTYGILPQILAGYTVNDVVSSKVSSRLPVRNDDWRTVDPIKVNNFNHIKCVIITDAPNKKLLVTQFVDLGWSLNETSSSNMSSFPLILHRNKSPNE